MIIIPTFNERENIRQLYDRIRKVLPDIPVLFVDDSNDGTDEEIEKIQSADKNIHLIHRPNKRGFATAYLDGFEFVFKFNPQFIVTMDGDLSHPPEKIPELLQQVRLGFVAVGSRY